MAFVPPTASKAGTAWGTERSRCPVSSALQRAGYNGYFDVELMGEAIEACDYQQLLERSKQAFQQLMLN